MAAEGVGREDLDSAHFDIFSGMCILYPGNKGLCVCVLLALNLFKKKNNAWLFYIQKTLKNTFEKC